MGFGSNKIIIFSMELVIIFWLLLGSVNSWEFCLGHGLLFIWKGFGLLSNCDIYIFDDFFFNYDQILKINYLSTIHCKFNYILIRIGYAKFQILYDNYFQWCI